MNKQMLLEGRVMFTFVEAEQPNPVVVVRANCGGFITTMTGATAMAYTLPADKQVELSISYQDKNGNPATIDGQVTWDTSDANVANVQPSTDNPQADNSVVVMVPGTAVGNCQISARADADLGEGVRELVTLLDVTVVGGEAITGVITPGEPTDQPTARGR